MSRAVKIDQNISESSFNSDSSMKQEYHNNDEQAERKKKRWMVIAIIAAIFCIIVIIAIAVPITIMQQRTNSKQNSENNQNVMNAQTINGAPINKDGDVMMIKQQQYPNTLGKLYTADNQISQHPPVYAHAVSPYANLTRLKIFTPPSSPESRIFVMGDIHGCLNEMNQLLQAIQFQPNKDVLILTGDLVYRGQDSIGVIRRATELNALCVRGNHDDKVIRLRGFQDKFGEDAMSPPKEIMPEGEVGDPLKFKNKHVEIARLVFIQIIERKSILFNAFYMHLECSALKIMNT